MKNARNKAAVAPRRRSPAGPLRTSAPVTILHIDDDPNDTELLQAAVRRAGVQFSVRNVNDGEQTIAYFNGRGIYANRELYPLPVLVLLDLKMPRATGFEVLQWIRNHPEIGSVPVVVFSGSELQDDIQQAYAVGADSYLVKPIGFNALVDLVKNINSAWILARNSRSVSWAAPQPGRGWQDNEEWHDPEGGEGARP